MCCVTGSFHPTMQNFNSILNNTDNNIFQIYLKILLFIFTPNFVTAFHGYVFYNSYNLYFSLIYRYSNKICIILLEFYKYKKSFIFSGNVLSSRQRGVSTWKASILQLLNRWPFRFKNFRLWSQNTHYPV